MNIQIDASVNAFLQKPEKYVLRLKTNLLVAEKKGLWTWIKTKWDRASYQLPAIVRSLEGSQKSLGNAQFRQCLQAKVTNYNGRHPDHQIVSNLFLEATNPLPAFTEKPLVSDAMPMRRVAEQYKNRAMQELLLSLGSEGYQMREVHGDGHCCFRAFGAYLLSLPRDQVQRHMAAVMNQINRELPPSLKARLEKSYESVKTALQSESPKRILLDPALSDRLVEFLRIAAAVQVDRDGLSYLENYVDTMTGMDGAPNRHGGSSELDALSKLFEVKHALIQFDDSAKPLGATLQSLDRAMELFSQRYADDAVKQLQAAGRALEKSSTLFGDAAAVLKGTNEESASQDLKRAQSLFRKATLVHEAISNELGVAATLLSKVKQARSEDVQEALQALQVTRARLAALEQQVPKALKAENVEQRLKERQKELSQLPAGQSDLKELIAKLNKINRLLEEAALDVPQTKTLADDVRAYEDQMRQADWKEPLASLKNAPLGLLFLGHGHYNLLVK